MPWNLLLLLHHRFIVTGYCFQVPTESKIDHCHLSATMFSSPLSNKSFYPLNYFWWFMGRTFESFLYFCSFLFSFSILKIELYCWGKFENKQMWLTSAFNSLLNSFLKEKKQFQQLRIVLQIRDDLTNSLVHLQRHFQGGKSVKIHAGNSVGGYSSWEISFREISIPPPQPSKQLRLLSSSLTSARDMSLFMPPILHPSTLLSRPMYVDSPTSPRLQIFILSNPRKVEPVWRNRSLSLSRPWFERKGIERYYKSLVERVIFSAVHFPRPSREIIADISSSRFPLPFQWNLAKLPAIPFSQTSRIARRGMEEYWLEGGGYFPDDYFRELSSRREANGWNLDRVCVVCYFVICSMLFVAPPPLYQGISYQGLCKKETVFVLIGLIRTPVRQNFCLILQLCAFTFLRSENGLKETLLLRLSTSLNSETVKHPLSPLYLTPKLPLFNFIINRENLLLFD